MGKEIGVDSKAAYKKLWAIKNKHRDQRKNGGGPSTPRKPKADSAPKSTPAKRMADPADPEAELADVTGKRRRVSGVHEDGGSKDGAA